MTNNTHIKHGSVIRQCRWCKKDFFPVSTNQYYCRESDCARQAKAEQQKAFHARRKAEAEAGTLMPKQPTTGEADLRCAFCERSYSKCTCICPTCGQRRYSPDPRWPLEHLHHSFAACAHKLSRRESEHLPMLPQAEAR
jgi:hypothetical protein